MGTGGQAHGDEVHIVGMSGSLRRASMNSGLLRAVQKQLPDGVTMEIIDLHALPFYDGDIDTPTQPEAVVQMKEALARADGLLLASPEYNYSFTGVLKNALDWASRPHANSPLAHLPTAIMGVGGRYGTVRGQLQLRQVLFATRCAVMPKPEFMLSLARDKFDEQGNLTDASVRRDVEHFAAAFVAWIQLQQSAVRQPA